MLRVEVFFNILLFHRVQLIGVNKNLCHLHSGVQVSHRIIAHPNRTALRRYIRGMLHFTLQLPVNVMPQVLHVNVRICERHSVDGPCGFRLSHRLHSRTDMQCLDAGSGNDGKIVTPT
jgi:hypothetical protein